MTKKPQEANTVVILQNVTKLCIWFLTRVMQEMV